MSNESSQPQFDLATDSAPNGAEIVSETKNTHAIEPELLERVEAEARRVAVSVIKHEMHSGPMPSPKQFRDYDAALPGTALIIRDEFQANGQHVRDSEKRALEATIGDNRENRKTAERLVWGSLAFVLVLALAGHENVAIAVAVSTVAAVITGFLQKRSAKPPATVPQEGE
ncbi:MAG: hypothetical protein RBS05_07565 [Zoogloea oleivorans]|jgi:uncharacterized membrane protein|uniref:hypothetical protein n=1 Tax=Zoogloea oleivorans TaxID=1552750 RepID=UPI002A367B72|nr:hypothetical protein [Zoogloea oleivorans]MDY0035746.1 hypothetical protein [Zoogloea oleivorans]